jgi:DtxR family Mn-dependent transcriptional regulator
MGLSESSASTLRFLCAIYLATVEGPRVTLSMVGRRLGVSAPAVSRRAARLIRRGYLMRDGACGLVFTHKGERVALRAIRKQEVCEAFLASVVGYRWDEVFPIAWKMAVHLPDELIERMYLQAGRPGRCPHGHPIPALNGRIEPILDQPLTTLKDHQCGTVSRVLTHDSELLRYLDAIHLRPGSRVRVLARAPFNGPIHIAVQAGEREAEIETAIGAEAASYVHVEWAQ